jgi:hypothetical protein
MKRILFQEKVWQKENREFTPALLQLLTAKDCLIVLFHGRPAYKVILGVPHQAGIGQPFICDSQVKRESDENSASYALVAYSMLKESGIPCKIVIAAHSTTADPNKVLDSPYCQEVFQECGELLLECHGAGLHRKLDLELSSGRNSLADIKGFGEALALALQKRYTLGVQRKCGTDKAIILGKDGKKIDGRLENPALLTKSLARAEEMKIPALHVEAKPQFRRSQDKADKVTEDGAILGRALARAIIEGWAR